MAQTSRLARILLQGTTARSARNTGFCSRAAPSVEPALFGRRNPRMLRGSIARDSVPDGASDDADGGANPEGGTPAVMDHQVRDEWRRNSSTNTHAGKNPAVGEAALVDGNPARYELIRRRVNDGFACSQQEANADKNEERSGNGRRHGGGERGENSPPQHADREDPARSQADGEPAADGLKYCIAPEKCAEDPAELHVAEVIAGGDGRAGNGHVDAVEKRDAAEDEEPENQQPAHAGGAHLVGCGQIHIGVVGAVPLANE